MPPPPWQASPLVQALPSSRGVVSATAVPTHAPLWPVSPVVQGLPSSHGVLSGSGVPAQTPPWQVSLLVQEFSSSHAAPSSSAALPTQVPVWQVSAAVQALPSSQLVPVSGVPAQLDVPSQVGVLHWSEVQVIVVPTHCPPLVQVSLKVQALPSSQLVPVSGVTVQLAVPSQVRVLHWSEVQVIVVPTHCPPLVQVSLKVQGLPSSQLVPVSGVTGQLDVPLQVRVLHVSEVQAMAVPTHCPPPSQGSLKVQVLPSSHAAPVLGVTVQLDVPLQVRVLHVSEVQVMAVLWQTPASQVSMVQAFPSLQSATVEHGVQPAMAVLSQTPASQVSVVQAFPSLQSAAVEQGVQPAIVLDWQTPALQDSIVQALPSSQSLAVVQGVQPAIAVFWQTPPEQESVVQAFWSLQSTAVEQSLQPASSVYRHKPALHESDVQGFWSLQSAAVAQVGRTPTQFSPVSPPLWF